MLVAKKEKTMKHPENADLFGSFFSETPPPYLLFDREGGYGAYTLMIPGHFSFGKGVDVYHMDASGRRGLAGRYDSDDRMTPEELDEIGTRSSLGTLPEETLKTALSLLQTAGITAVNESPSESPCRKPSSGAARRSSCTFE